VCKTIKLKTRFQASPESVYRLLVDPREQRAFSGEPARAEPRPGAKFSAYGGRISGIVVDLLPGRRVVQAWRAREFPIGIFSMATFNLVPTSQGGTELTLTHRGVPKELIPQTMENWRVLYWEKMKRYLQTQSRKRSRSIPSD
jgi:uncharacterized protein YndB with AHSA1/START domain